MASQELNQALWGAANVMRGTMSADVYKDYLLGLVFYKYLSDRQLYAVVDLLENRRPQSLDEAQQIYEEAASSEDWEELKEELEESYGFAIEPKYTFTALYYDNACIESFHSLIKKEEIYRRFYKDSKEAYKSIFEYIESWYNRQRTHSSLGYKTPAAVHAEGAA